MVDLLTERHPVELIEQGLMEALQDTGCLRTLSFGAAMVDILPRPGTTYTHAVPDYHNTPGLDRCHLQARIAIARQQAETRHQLLSTVKLQYEKGIAAELQVRQAEGSLAQVEAQIPVLEAGLDSAMNTLDVLLGAQPGTYRAELSPAASIPIAPRLAGTGMPAEMIRRRPDLIVFERRLAAANARIGVAISEYYPKFSLGALLGSATAISSGNLFTTGANQAQGVLGLRWHLFDFGRVDAQIATARGQEAEPLAAYRLAVLRGPRKWRTPFRPSSNARP